jgi:hypothetical protein
MTNNNGQKDVGKIEGSNTTHRRADRGRDKVQRERERERADNEQTGDKRHAMSICVCIAFQCDNRYIYNSICMYII